MSDYFQSGGVNQNLDVFTNRRKFGSSVPSPATRKEELYLSGYGRQWGEKLTYSTGVAYGTGEKY